MGNFDYNTQVDFDPVKLLSLGFTNQEVETLGSFINMGYKVNNNTLSMLGLDYEQQQRIKYMYNICLGRVSTDTEEELIRHLKKMNNHAYKIGLKDLPISKIQQVPRIALVAGIKQEPYSIWNSNRYKGKDMLYLVTDVSGSKITIETARKPKLEYRASMSVPDVLDIKGIKTNGKVVISFNKNYCRLCNRFIIVATLRRPEFHHGVYKIICFEGTTVYVYARTMGVRDGVRYNGSTERVYAYGFFPNEIKSKLDAVAKGIYGRLRGVKADYDAGNQEFRMLDIVRKDMDVEDGVEF